MWQNPLVCYHSYETTKKKRRNCYFPTIMARSLLKCCVFAEWRKHFNISARAERCIRNRRTFYFMNIIWNFTTNVNNIINKYVQHLVFRYTENKFCRTILKLHLHSVNATITWMCLFCCCRCCCCCFICYFMFVYVFLPVCVYNFACIHLCLCLYHHRFFVNFVRHKFQHGFRIFGGWECFGAEAFK